MALWLPRSGPAPLEILQWVPDEQQRCFWMQSTMACRVAKIFNEHGARKGGVIRIDSAEFGVEKWKSNPGEGTARIIDTFKKAANIAADHGEQLLQKVKFAGRECIAGKMFWIFLKE